METLMHHLLKGTLVSAFLFVFTAVSADAQVNVLAPVLKSNSKGAFKPFKAKGNAEFDVTVRLYEDSEGSMQIDDDIGEPWEETLSFSVQGKTVLPASDPATGSYSLYVPVDGFLDLNIGVKTPLPSGLGDGFVYFTTEVTPYKKGVAKDPYQKSPTKLLPRSAPERYMSLVELDDGQGGTVKTLRIEGANLQIVNGTGTTDGAVDGLGNLIVGYNETGNPNGDDRTGSHNIVTGQANNFSSYGGLVVGSDNIISGKWSSVSGGYHNTASGFAASVSGGKYNEASGYSSSVSGGFYNTAIGSRSSVSGGFDNTTIGSQSSVSGGKYNTASGYHSSVSGGYTNTAYGSHSSVSGGALNTASGGLSSVSGGVINEAGGYRSSVSGGYNRSALSEDNWAAGSLSESN
jgi:hypothetical protein